MGKTFEEMLPQGSDPPLSPEVSERRSTDDVPRWGPERRPRDYGYSGTGEGFPLSPVSTFPLGPVHGRNERIDHDVTGFVLPSPTSGLRVVTCGRKTDRPCPTVRRPLSRGCKVSLRSPHGPSSPPRPTRGGCQGSRVLSVVVRPVGQGRTSNVSQG